MKRYVSNIQNEVTELTTEDIDVKPQNENTEKKENDKK